MANWDYDKEPDLYDDAVDRGEDAFADYMNERFDDSDFDWDRWSMVVGEED